MDQRKLHSLIPPTVYKRLVTYIAAIGQIDTEGSSSNSNGHAIIGQVGRTEIGAVDNSIMVSGSTPKHTKQATTPGRKGSMVPFKQVGDNQSDGNYNELSSAL